MTDTNEILEEINRRSPVMLNGTIEHKVDSQLVKLPFHDQHEFIVKLPAWVFRRVKEVLNAPK